MSEQILRSLTNYSRKWWLLAVAAVVVATFWLGGGISKAAACTMPTTDYGKMTLSVSIPTSTKYRIWTRMKVPDSSHSTYLLQVGTDYCYEVGGSSVTAGNWVWIPYQSSGTSAMLDKYLTAGTHKLTLIGNSEGVKVDRLVLVSDLNCTPTGMGDNCDSSVTADLTPPTVSISAPAASATVAGSTDITESASDNVGVSKVETYINSTLLSTKTSAPYTTAWDTTKSPNGSQLITVRAFDAAGNASTATATVTVKNSDTEPPTEPTNVKATATSPTKVTLTWTAATDNVGVVKYKIFRDDVPLEVTNDNSTTYVDNTVMPSTSYTYRLRALDAEGNRSTWTDAVSVKTPSLADTEQPSKPTDLQASSVSSSQVNLVWKPTYDNVGVVKYDVYRIGDHKAAQKIATVKTSSFGDTGLKADTTYYYYVVAIDAAGNDSYQSDHVKVTTTKNSWYSVLGIMITTPAVRIDL